MIKTILKYMIIATICVFIFYLALGLMITYVKVEYFLHIGMFLFLVYLILQCKEYGAEDDYDEEETEDE